MFIQRTNTEPTGIDKVIADLQTEMESVTGDSEEYAAMVVQLAKLHAIKTEHGRKRVSPDVLLTAGANLAGILAILHFEKVNVITSKAVGFVMKLR